MPTGQALSQEIEATPAPRGSCAFWWLGQMGFVLKCGDQVLYVDAFLAAYPGRRIPPLLQPAEAAHASLILGTHDHADHIDRVVWPDWSHSAARAKFVVPEILKKQLSAELGIPPERMVGLTDLQTGEWNGVKITGIAAAHEFLDRDEPTGLYPYLGYVIEANGCTLYHSGDCCVYEGLQAKLSKWKFDVMFLPINGRDARRLKMNIIGNMTYQEAADLAGALKPGLVVPAHFEMFEPNREDPQLFADYMAVKYPRQNVLIPRHGERMIIGG